VAFLDNSYTPAEGDSIIVWNATNFSGTPKFDLPELPRGYSWNTSRISEGKLFVDYDPTAIENVAADAEVEVVVVTTGGTVVDKFVCPFGSVENVFRQSTLPTGVYMLQIKTANGTAVRKYVK
jgi:hypothetical protein